MIEIKQIATVEQLYARRKELTGNVLVDAVVEYLRVMPDHEPIIMAKTLGVDRRMLSKAMEIFVGVPLKEMIWQWRVHQAVDLLDNKALSIEEVSHCTGYGTVKSLSAAMMKYFGTTPTIYRTGTINGNGSYEMNINRQLLRKAQENARKLHARTWSAVANKQ